MKKTAGLDGFRKSALPKIQESDNYNLIQKFPETEKREYSPTHSEPMVLYQTGKDSMKRES